VKNIKKEKKKEKSIAKFRKNVKKIKNEKKKENIFEKCEKM